MSIPPDNSHSASSTPPPNRPSAMIGRLKTSWSNPSKRPMLIFGFGAVGIAAVLLLVAIAQLVGTETPTPTPTPTPSCVGSNCPPPSNPIIPKKLYVRDRTFEITPVAVDKDRPWKPTATDGNVEWVFGSLVNYLIGLPNTQENKDLLNALSQADQITLELADGQTKEFKFDAQQQVAPDNKTIFTQQHPGLTLVLLGDDSQQRLVVTANYDVEKSETNSTVPSSVVAINTPIEIGPVRVKVLSGRLVENAPGIPVGSAFYLVDFTAENIGEDALNVSNFVFQLLDYAGVKYDVKDIASKLGPNPPPSGQLLPGLSGTFTVGFQVPSNITGPILTWTFKPDATFKGQAAVAVPLLGPTPTPDPRTQIKVQISQAYYTPDQSELIVVGNIANPTTALIPIGPADITLSTQEVGGILATLNASDPSLPLRLGPGDNLDITLHFSRLPSATAILKILSNSFELTLR